MTTLRAVSDQPFHMARGSRHNGDETKKPVASARLIDCATAIVQTAKLSV